MKQRKVLIDSCFIHNSGSLHVLETTIAYFNEKGVKVLLLKDLRNKSNLLFENLRVIRVNFLTRLPALFYFKAKGYFIIGMNNVGSLVPSLVDIVYFHNMNMLSRETTSLFRWVYLKISFRTNKKYLVQTGHVKHELKRFTSANIVVAPIFNIRAFRNIGFQGLPFDFCFPGVYYEHKNFELCLAAWKTYKDQGGLGTLYFTLDVKSCKKLQGLIDFEYYSIINLGWLTPDRLLHHYSSIRNFIILSERESLGIPFLEVGSMPGRRLVALKLPHMDEILDGVIFVDKNVDSVVRGINEAINAENPFKLSVRIESCEGLLLSLCNY